MTLGEYLKSINHPLTEWFPAYGDKPVRRGWYMTAMRSPYGIGGVDVIGFSYWSGKQWSNMRGVPEGKPTYNGAEQYKKWRGILRK